MEVLCAAITLPRPDTELNLTTLEHIQSMDEATITVDLAPATVTNPIAESTQADPANANSVSTQAILPRPKRKKTRRKKKTGIVLETPGIVSESAVTSLPQPGSAPGLAVNHE